MLRPYSSLDYAWDEPSQPHRLVLALPGNRKLGAYDLDKVRAALPTPELVQATLPWSPPVLPAWTCNPLLVVRLRD